MKLLYLVLFLSGQAMLAASSILVGAPGDPSSGNRVPFEAPLAGAPGTLSQQVYNSNNFPGPITIYPQLDPPGIEHFFASADAVGGPVAQAP